MIPLWHKWTDNLEEVQDLWLTSLALLFSFLDAWSARSEHQVRTHPPAGVRLLGIASVIFDDVTQGFATGADAIETWSQEALQIGGRVYSALERAAHVWEVVDLPTVSARLVTAQPGLESLISEFNRYRRKLIEFNQWKEELGPRLCP
jgi:hypothetical protein